VCMEVRPYLCVLRRGEALSRCTTSFKLLYREEVWRAELQRGIEVRGGGERACKASCAETSVVDSVRQGRGEEKEGQVENRQLKLPSYLPLLRLRQRNADRPLQL
jgi:hypothetical protein